MALHTTLPIYKVAYDLLSIATDLVRNMPRDIKAVIGDRLRDLCLELVLLILRANCAANKVPHLETLLEHLAETELLLRLCQDKRFISKAQYATAIRLADNVGKQANGWRKYNASPAT